MGTAPGRCGSKQESEICLLAIFVSSSSECVTGRRVEIDEEDQFDRYLEEQLQDTAFAARFERAVGRDVALQIAALRQQTRQRGW